MPKPTKKELLEAMKDPDLLKEAGLQPVSDDEEKELFSDITVDENDTMADVVRKINSKQKQQRAYLKKREGKILKSAEEKASQGERDRRKQEVDSFLETHPELSANKDLLDIVDPLYANGKSLEDAWKIACDSKGFDIETGKAPVEGKEGKPDEKKEEQKKKTTPLKSDTIDSGLPGVVKDDDKDERPKSIREIAGDISNTLAAKGENPFRDS